MDAYLGELEQLVLLAVLNLGEDGYAVPIRALLQARARRNLAMPTVYTTLDRLEGKGLVRSRLGDPTPERGGRRKRFYTATPLGERALRTSLTSVQALTAPLGRRWQR